jgi:hypothetical protein
MERAERSGPPEALKRSMSGLPPPPKKNSSLRFQLGVPPIQDRADANDSASDTDSTESGMLENMRSRGSLASSSSNLSIFSVPTAVQVAETELWGENMEQHFHFDAPQMGLGDALSPRTVEKPIRRCVVNE